MKHVVLTTLSAFAIAALAACNQATTPSSSGSPGAAGTASARATGSVAASASAGASASAKQITLQVTVPEENAKAGVDGMGWTVDVVAKGSGPAMDKIKPAFRTSTNSGKNSAFPGLVILIRPVGSSAQTTSSASPSTASQPNLAGMFQVIGLPNTLGGAASISSVNTATSSPGSSASPAGSTGAASSASPAGSAATRSTTATDNETAEATWFVQQSQWGTDVDVELTAFVVDGDAPDTVTDRSQLKIISNEVTVRFHINGSGGASPSGSAAPRASGSAAPSGSPSGSSAAPSASPSKSP